MMVQQIPQRQYAISRRTSMPSITHDHRGRKLSPALANLLSTTVIPNQRRLHKRPSSSAISIPKGDFFGKTYNSACFDEKSPLSLDESQPSSVSSSTSTNSVSSFAEQAGSRPQKKHKELCDVCECDENNHPLATADEDDHDCPEFRTEGAAVDSQSSEEFKRTHKSPEALKASLQKIAASFKAFSTVAASFSSSTMRVQTAGALSVVPRSTDFCVRIEPERNQTLDSSPPEADEQQPGEDVDDVGAVTVVATVTDAAETADAAPAPAAAQDAAACSSHAEAMTTYSVQKTALPEIRPREPRVNSEFFRVYALESSMRSSGKFNDTYVGRAQYVLPPRRESAGPHYFMRFETTIPTHFRKEVPRRWIPVNAAE